MAILCYTVQIYCGWCVCVFVCVCMCVRERQRGEIEIAEREQDKTIKILEEPLKSYFTLLPSGQAGRQMYC